jgi:hypothetical protein
MIDYTPMADKRQARTARIRVRSSTTCGDFFVAKLWTTGVHDDAETGANTRVPASDLFRGLVAFTS